MPSDYQELLTQAAALRHLTSVTYLASWDQETYMPQGGSAARAAQAGLLSGVVHERLTGKNFERALGRLVDLATGEIRGRAPSPLQRDALRGLHRRYARAKRLPNAHVSAAAALYSEAQNVWARARQRRDFKLFEPWLRRIVDTKRREADYLGYAAHPYDALLDEFEPGATSAEISRLTAQVVAPIQALLADRRDRRLASLLRPPTPRETAKVREYILGLVADMGFDYSRGRIDAAEHPSTVAMHPGDVRFTLRRRSTTLLDDVFSALHECGHALYEQGLDPAQWGTPAADAISLGVHESQSRLWENVVGRSAHFWKRQLPKLTKALPALRSVSLERFMASLWTVTPSSLRLEADEVSYNLHIVLRFEIEKELIAGKLSVKDIPAAWSDMTKELLGVTPRHAGEGCLQDVHWSGGSIGYFPTYLLGNVFASQLFDSYRAANPAWAKQLEAGALAPLTRWLNRAVHRHGSRFSGSTLIARATGRPVSAEPFLRHLRQRYAK